MFNSLREFDEDQFFSESFQAHNERVRQMMRSFPDPFGGNFMPSLMDGRDRGRAGQGSTLAPRDEHRDLRNPFSFFDNMMSGMKSRMEDVNRNFGTPSSDPNCHSFRQSSVVTYSKNGNEPPKVFQASSQTHRAPGGIRETRRALRDSESGLEKMSIGHHIQDRGHVITKKNNRRTGEKELKQDFQNLDETEAQSFDQEWQRTVSRFQAHTPVFSLQGATAPQQHSLHLGTRSAPHTHRHSPKQDVPERKRINFKNSPDVFVSDTTRH